MTERRMGFPVVGVHVDFCYPSRVGDECVMKCWIEHLGTSSIRFAMTIEGVDGTLRLQGTETVVCVKPAGEGGGLKGFPSRKKPARSFCLISSIPNSRCAPENRRRAPRDARSLRQEAEGPSPGARLRP